MNGILFLFQNAVVETLYTHAHIKITKWIIAKNIAKNLRLSPIFHLISVCIYLRVLSHVKCLNMILRSQE